MFVKPLSLASRGRLRPPLAALDKSSRNPFVKRFFIKVLLIISKQERLSTDNNDFKNMFLKYH